MNIVELISELDISEIEIGDIVKVTGVIYNEEFTDYNDSFLNFYKDWFKFYKDDLLKVIDIDMAHCPYCLHYGTCIIVETSEGGCMALSCYFDFSKNGRKIKKQEVGD